MSAQAAQIDTLRLFTGGEDLGRRRGQRKGHLRIEHGSWLLTYRVYDQNNNSRRETVKIGNATGADGFTKKQAERIAWDHYLSKVDLTVQHPKAMVTLGEFWDSKYKPHCMLKLKKTTRDQYFSLYERWIKPPLQHKRLSNVSMEDVDAVMAAVIEAKRSTSTARACRKVLAALFTRAKRMKYAVGDNPALVSEPIEIEPVRKKVSLSFDQMKQVLAALKEPVRTMALTAVLTSMNVAELCGLRWSHINLTAEFQTFDGAALPPYTIAVRRHFSRGEETSLKTGARKRNIPIPDLLLGALQNLQKRPKFSGPDDVVFCTPKGTPQNQNNVRRRVFDPLGKNLGLTRLSWHVFRYSHATFTEAIGMSPRDRQSLMGHAALAMTQQYTSDDHDRMRRGLDQIAARLLSDDKGTIQ